MYAVIETGGKQYRVEVGTELEVELLDANAGDAITLDRVPLVAGASVSAQVVRHDRGPKLISFKYRPKARRRVKKGHRQDLLLLRITDVVLNGKSAAAAIEKIESDAKTERQRLEEGAQRQAAEDAKLAARLAAQNAPKTEAKSEAKPATKADSKKPAAKASTKPAAKASAKPDAKAQTKAAAKPAAKAVTKAPAKPAPKSTTKKDG